MKKLPNGCNRERWTFRVDDRVAVRANGHKVGPWVNFILLADFRQRAKMMNVNVTAKAGAVGSAKIKAAHRARCAMNTLAGFAGCPAAFVAVDIHEPPSALGCWCEAIGLQVKVVAVVIGNNGFKLRCYALVESRVASRITRPPKSGISMRMWSTGTNISKM